MDWQNYSGLMDQLQPRHKIAVDAAVGGTLAAIGAAAGGPLGAGLAQAATPAVSAAISQIFTTLADNSASRASQTMVSAAQTAGVDENTLAEQMLLHRAKAVLLGRALDGAARSIAEEKIEWFAKCIANGYLAEDDAVVDRETFYVSAFTELEAPHIRVLLFIAEWERTGDRATPPTTDELSDAFSRQLCPVIRPVLTTLERAGLVVKRVGQSSAGKAASQRETGVPHVWEISTFATHLMRRIGHTPPDRVRPYRDDRLRTADANQPVPTPPAPDFSGDLGSGRGCS
jgi:hypothetical protein